jgi:hypothetical protein
MSRRSFERYKKELKKKVMKAASSNSLKCIGSTKGMRRASISMCDLIRNDSFEEITPSPSNKIGRMSMKQRPRSSSMNSAAVADVEHDLVATLISSFKNAHGGKSEGADKAPHDTLLTADEMVVLKNMMRRLSQGAPPTHFPSMQDLIQRGPSENDLCSSSSEEESLSPREDMRRPSKDAQKDEKRKYPSALLSDSHPDASSLQSLEGDTNREKGVFLNEVNFSGEPSSFKQGHRNHPIQEVELNRWQSGTSASMLSPPQFVKDTSIGSISTGVIAIASIKPLNVSDMKRDATDIKTYGGKFVDTDMEDKAQQIQVDGDTDRTPSMPQVRRSATSESMTRRPSTHGNMNKKMSSSSVIEVTNHAHSCAMGRTSSSSLFSTSTSDLNGPPFKQDCGDILAEGIEHLSMAMLINIYSKLREMSLLGHVSVKLRDIDVNSHQYNSRKKELKRLGHWTAADEAKGYLDSTRKAGFIVRAVMDEHELFEADHARGADNDIKHALLAYDAR